MRTSIPKIVNVRYKNVIRNDYFPINELQLEIKQQVDSLCDTIGSEPTGYYLAVFGDNTNTSMARTYHFTQDCPIGAWQAADLIKKSIV